MKVWFYISNEDKEITLPCIAEDFFDINGRRVPSANRRPKQGCPALNTDSRTQELYQPKYPKMQWTAQTPHNHVDRREDTGERRTDVHSRYTAGRTHRRPCPSGVLSPSALGTIAMWASLRNQALVKPSRRSKAQPRIARSTVSKDLTTSATKIWKSPAIGLNLPENQSWTYKPRERALQPHSMPNDPTPRQSMFSKAAESFASEYC